MNNEEKPFIVLVQLNALNEHGEHEVEKTFWVDWNDSKERFTFMQNTIEWLNKARGNGFSVRSCFLLTEDNK